MRVGFVLRSTEIKPLFHDLSNFFYRIATLNISFSKDATGVVFINSSILFRLLLFFKFFRSIPQILKPALTLFVFNFYFLVSYLS